MRPSVVVAVSIILLMLFHLFSFVFYCETIALDSVATLWNNWLLQNKFNVHVRAAHTILITKFMSRALYAVPHIRVKSEVYFGINSNITPVLKGALELLWH